MADRDEWRVDAPSWGGPHDVSLTRREDAEYLQIDRDGELHVHADVRGDACDTNLFIPMATVVAFFAAAGWTLAPSPPRAPPATEGR